MSLMDNAAWAKASASEDPFAAERSTPPEACPAESFGPETVGGEVWFDVNTRNCPSLTVRQPLLIDVRRGEGVTVRLWHYRLTAPDPGEAHVAVALGTTVVWEARVPIPSASGVVVQTFPAPDSARPGDAVFFHVHNHGENAWSLVELTALR